MEEIKFRSYVADALQIAGSNTARFAGGSELTVRFSDLAYDFQPQETRTAEEIKEGIVAKIKALGGKP